MHRLMTALAAVSAAGYTGSMNTQRTGSSAVRMAMRLAGFVLTVTVLPAMAVTVHTWVDADGLRHFADAPPATAPPASLAEIEIAGARTPPGPDDDRYSIMNQWQRMREERDADEARALERKRLRLAARNQPSSTADRQPESNDSWFYPGYAFPPYAYPRPPGGHRHPPVVAAPRNRNTFVPLPVPVWPRQRASGR